MNDWYVEDHDITCANCTATIPAGTTYQYRPHSVGEYLTEAGYCEDCR